VGLVGGAEMGNGEVEGPMRIKSQHHAEMKLLLSSYAFLNNTEKTIAILDAKSVCFCFFRLDAKSVCFCFFRRKQ
jgi:hypothetical protein